MKRLIFGVWSAFLGAVAALTWVGLAGGPGEPQSPPSQADDPAIAEGAEPGRALYVGSARCAGCHRSTGLQHPRMLGPASEIARELLDQWPQLPDPQGNPVVFDENQAGGIDGTRDLELEDDRRLNGIAAVYVDVDGAFTARFLGDDGAIRHEQPVSPYHVGVR